MRIARYLMLVAGATLFTLMSPSLATVSAQSDKTAGFTVSSMPCAYNFTSGSGETLFKWCLTANGNVGYLESPVGYQHVYNEGYAVCWDDAGVNYFDYGSSTSGFGPPVVVAGCTTGSSCTLSRDTLDGVFRLKMAFTQNKPEKEINIVHTLTNLYTDSFVNIRIARQADLDMDNTAEYDASGQSSISVWMYQNFARVGLTRLTLTGQALHWIGGPNLAGSPCTQPAVGGYTDRSMGIAYSLPKINAQQSKSFKFQYRRD